MTAMIIENTASKLARRGMSKEVHDAYKRLARTHHPDKSRSLVDNEILATVQRLDDLVIPYLARDRRRAGTEEAVQRRPACGRHLRAPLQHPLGHKRDQGHHVGYGNGARTQALPSRDNDRDTVAFQSRAWTRSSVTQPEAQLFRSRRRAPLHARRGQPELRLSVLAGV